ncbi:MAG TPA: ATP-binding protein [Planctomycetota bacterium]|nr:ATP-binding protein [Planctomycetota bacterium]
MARRMRALDWSKTDVGPPEHWSQNLRIALGICLTSPFPMFVWWGPTFTILYNDAYIPFLGHTKHPGVLGRPGREAWYDIWDTIGPMLQSVRDTGKATWSEDILMFFDRELPKEEVYVTFSFSPVLGESGQVDGIHCACTEVTEKLVSQRRLETLRKLGVQASEGRSVEEACREAVRVLGDNRHDVPFAAVYAFSSSGKEARLVASMGLSPEKDRLPAVADAPSPWPIAAVLQSHRAVDVENLQALGLEIVGGPWPEACRRALVLPIPGATPETPAGVLVAGVGARRPYNAAYRTFFGLVAGQLGTAISDAKAYEEERRRAEALAELDRAKTLFFSNVSHEFRTPLTLILGPVRDALARPGQSLAGESLEAVHRNSVRLLKLVNSLLDFSRIEAGRVRASYQPTDLSALTRHLANVFESAAERAGLALEIDCPPLGEEVYVDRDMWEKIVLNLLSNAFKFTFEGKIRVSLRAEGADAQLDVRDTGVGIPAAELPRIFERFHRVEGTRARTHEGTGIGLALVQELVHLHQGTIAVESQEGKGTTFRVRIPRGTAHLPADRLLASAGPAPSSASTMEALNEIRSWQEPLAPRLEAAGSRTRVDASTPDVGVRILVADDNADMRQYVSEILGARWKVETVANGDTALERARAHPPDVVLSDVMMPGLDGFALLRELRRDERTRTVPVLLLSARAGEESKVEGLGGGADDYIVKPFSAVELVARVESAVRMSRLRREHERALRESESRLTQIIEELPFGVGLMDPSGRWMISNAALRRYSEQGIPSRDARQAARWRVFDPAGNPLPPEFWPGARALRGEVENLGMEVLFLDPEGRELWTRVSAAPFRDAGGAVVGAIATIIDIDQPKRALIALRESEARFRNMADHSPVMVWVTEPDGRCTFVAKSWYDFTGQAAEAGLGFGWLEALHPEDRESAKKIFLAANARRESIRVEYRLRRKDGEWRWVVAAAAPRFDPTGEFLGYIGSAIDFTEQKAAQETLERRVEERTAELRSALRELETFSYTVAHDLRAPLRSMSQYSDLLLEECSVGLGEEGRTYAGQIGQAAQRMDRLTSDLLDYSRFTLARVDVKPLELSAILSEVLRSLAAEVAGTKAVVRADLNGYRVMADPLLLSQAMTNLVANAIKFAEPGRPPEVTVRAEERGSRVRLWVEDQGIGIDPAHTSKLFRIFERLEPGRFPGTGMGLAIVKKAAERMGGEVGVESRPTQGSRFWIELPRVPPG